LDALIAAISVASEIVGRHCNCHIYSAPDDGGHTLYAKENAAETSSTNARGTGLDIRRPMMFMGKRVIFNHFTPPHCVGFDRMSEPRLIAKMIRSRYPRA
jgi:hypothetical protein